MKLKRPIREFTDPNGAQVKVPLEFNIVGVDRESKTFICELLALESIMVDSDVPACIAKEVSEKIIEQATEKLNALLPMTLCDESQHKICNVLNSVMQDVFFEYSIEGAYLSDKGNLIFT